MGKLTEAHKNLLKKIAHSENINDYDVILCSGASKGDGYLSHIQGIKIKDRKSAKELNLILKSSPVFQEDFMKDTYSREIYFYDKVIPTLDNFLKKNNASDLLNAIPKCYGTISEKGKESLIMENLKVSGYALWKRRVPITDDVAKMVFMEYGKFHAVSLAYLHKYPEDHKKLVEPIQKFPMASLEENDEMAKQFKGMTYTKLAKCLQHDQKVLESFTNYWNNSDDFFAMYNIEPNEYSVILHGDAWTNNILFRYKNGSNSNIPSSLKLIDFQMSRYSSSSFDLAGFFSICCTKDLFGNISNYLNIYYDSLSSTLKRLGCDANEVYPRMQFDKEWQKYRLYGIGLAMMFIRQLLIDNDEILDNMNDLAFADRQKEMDKDIKNQDKLEQRIYDLIKFMVDNKWI